MREAEKLRLLMDLAEQHGYVRTAQNDLGPPIVPGADGLDAITTTLENVLFDQDFIRSLCRAKYGASDPTEDELAEDAPIPVFGWFADESSVVLKRNVWEVIICQLALSTDRIGYLAKEFLE